MQKIVHSKDGLYRYRKTKLVGGVFAGLSDKWGLHLWGMRIVFLLLLLFIFFTWIIVIVYVVLWVILPLRGPEPENLRGSEPENKQRDYWQEMDLIDKNLLNSFHKAVEAGNIHQAIKHGEAFIKRTPFYEPRRKMKKEVKELYRQLKT